MRAKFIRGENSKRSMGIGRITFDNIKVGDILKVKKTIGINNRHMIMDPSGSHNYYNTILTPGDYGVIMEIKEKKYYPKNYLELNIIFEVDLETAKYNSNAILTGSGYAGTTGESLESIDTWKEFFDIIQSWELKESLDFKRGGNPLRQMNIGMLGWKDIKKGTVVQCIKDVVTKSGRFSDLIVFDKTVNPRMGYWGKGDYGIIKSVVYNSEKKLGIVFIPLTTKEDIKEILPKIKKNSISSNLYATIYGIETIETWKKYFKIIQPRDL